MVGARRYVVHNGLENVIFPKWEICTLPQAPGHDNDENNDNYNDDDYLDHVHKKRTLLYELTELWAFTPRKSENDKKARQGEDQVRHSRSRKEDKTIHKCNQL